MTTASRIAILTGVVMLLTETGFAKEKALECPIEENPPTMDYQAYERIAMERDQFVSDAITVLRSSRGDFHMNDPRFTAIRVAQKFRASEATNSLCDMVDAWAPAPGVTRGVGNIVTTENSRRGNGYAGVAAHYPAAKALVEIGVPAAQECLNRLYVDGCTQKSWLYLWVIRETYGEKPGRLAIKERFKTAGKDHHIQEALKAVLAEYDRLESYIEKK